MLQSIEVENCKNAMLDRINQGKLAFQPQGAVLTSQEHALEGPLEALGGLSGQIRYQDTIWQMRTLKRALDGLLAGKVK